MNKLKKLILSLGIAVAMVIAFVIGVNKQEKISIMGGAINNNATQNEVNVDKNITKANINYTFEEGEVAIQKGSSSIDFTYSPDVNQSATSVAYQYCFNNPMKLDMAVNLKEITTTSVTLSYAYSDTKLDSITNSNSLFEAQNIASYKTKYIYIIVSSENDVSSTFSSSVVWYQGEAGKINLVTNGETITQTIVKGQEIDKPYMEIASGSECNWYVDEECTTVVTFPLEVQKETLYSRVSNLPSDWLSLINGSYYVTKGTSSLPENLVIPSTYKGIKVTQLQDTVFQNITTLKSVELPNTITIINNRAFHNCDSLTNIIMSNNITTIGEYAFAYSGLSSIDIPSSVTTIEHYGFYSCKSLTTVTFGNSSQLTNMGGHIFDDCSALISLTIPKGITAIPEYAFYNCTALVNVYFESACQLESIGAKAFTFCKNLVNIMLKDSKLISIGSEAFYDCSALTEVTLPEGLTTIDSSAFRTCSALSAINIPSTLTTIGDYAFYYCSALSGSVTIPSSVTKIGVRAFRSVGFSEIKFENPNNWYYTQNSDYTGGTAFAEGGLSNVAISTDYLKNSYYTFYWYK